MQINEYPSPCYILNEKLLRANMALIADVAAQTGVEMIVALKACAMWSIFPIMREYVHSATASSLAEARLVYEEFGSLSHTYAPIYTESDFEQIMRYSDHITFNSLGQFDRFGAQALLRGISCGLRINPEFSSVDTGLYNPCSEGSRLGIRAEDLTSLPKGVEGLHFHTLCESRTEDLAATLEVVEQKFGHLLPHIKWINMGGGHLMTHKNYDTAELIKILRDFRAKHPHLRVILEPGSAYTWQTGVLTATVEDIVENRGTHTALLNVSFACHMPDCLEMPYRPVIRGAHEPNEGDKRWRMGGNSCLAGDFCGDWAFDHELKIGERVIFEDMIHYTMVKTTMFNGVAHPSIAIEQADGTLKIVREFGYDDYKNRMS